MSIKEAAKILGLAPQTVYIKVTQREIAHHRYGRRIDISEADLEAYRQKCRVEARAEEVAVPPPPVRVKLKRLGI